MALCGITSTFIGFYWLQSTIQRFGGFSTSAAFLVMLLFALGSSIQFLLFAFFSRNAPQFLSRAHLQYAFAWIASEQFSVRIFPWSLGHTQLGLLPLVQGADILGASGITFLMFVISDTVINRRHAFFSPLLGVSLLVGMTWYGVVHLHHFETTSYPSQKVAIVQANVSIVDKHNTLLVEANEERYRELSRAHAENETLIIWPESVITRLIPDESRFRRREFELPDFPNNPAFLIGALTFDAQKRLYNSALAVHQSGEISAPYHKQVLMPFGEYIPFTRVFPWIKYFAPELYEFTAGTEARSIRFGFDQGSGVEQLLHVAPLICYEDVISAPSRFATLLGADVLINLTNDAWFGNTVALHQHHQIASFRAIENRRTLIRSTNSGLTAIVNPSGRTVESLPPYSEGVLSRSVPLVSDKTIATVIGPDTLWWLLSLSMLIATIGKRAYYWYSTRRKNN
jgi:apolipoprotein N-acyltransferase